MFLNVVQFLELIQFLITPEQQKILVHVDKNKTHTESVVWLIQHKDPYSDELSDTTNIGTTMCYVNCVTYDVRVKSSDYINSGIDNFDKVSQSYVTPTRSKLYPSKLCPSKLWPSTMCPSKLSSLLLWLIATWVNLLWTKLRDYVVSRVNLFQIILMFLLLYIFKCINIFIVIYTFNTFFIVTLTYIFNKLCNQCLR